MTAKEMAPQGLTQSQLAGRSVTAGAKFGDLAYRAESLILALQAASGEALSHRALCRVTPSEDLTEMEVQTRNFGRGRIRMRFMAVGDESRARFYVERPGRQDIGENLWVPVAKFDLDNNGVCWLPDASGDLVEEVRPDDHQRNNGDPLMTLLYRIHHWIATSDD